jgi:hypothetical protein
MDELYLYHIYNETDESECVILIAPEESIVDYLVDGDTVRFTGKVTPISGHLDLASGTKFEGWW